MGNYSAPTDNVSINYPEHGNYATETAGLVNNLSFRDALAILFILLALFFVVQAWKREPDIEQARTEAEEELHKIGLDIDDLESHKAMSLIKLQQHPKYARRIQKIAEEAMISDMAM